MPVPHRDSRLVAQLVEPEKLVVDEGLQRADINTADGFGHILGKQGDDGEKGGLGLAGGGGGGEQHIVVGVENGIRRGNLNGTEAFPVVPVDIVLHKGGIAVKSTHSGLPYSSNSANSVSEAAESTSFLAKEKLSEPRRARTFVPGFW